MVNQTPSNSVVTMQSANTTGSDELVGIRRALHQELLDADEEGEATVRVRCDHLRAAIQPAIATPSPAGSDELVERLRGELRGVHDALGHLEYFEVREPDLHLTQDDCRAIIRDALNAIAALDTDRVAVREAALQVRAAAHAELAVCNDIMATVLASMAPEGLSAPNNAEAKLERICKKIEAFRERSQRSIDEARAALSQPLGSQGGK